MSGANILQGFQIRFDGPPGPDGPRFIDVESLEGESFQLGKWKEDPDNQGQWLIVVNQLRSKPIFVPWTNTDLTEGRGRQVPIAVCTSPATARRLGLSDEDIQLLRTRAEP